jgi:beta-glucosidase
MRQHKNIVIIWALTALFCTSAQATGSPADLDEKRVESILKQLTLEEKIDLLGGVDVAFTREVKRLNIPRLRMSDGPLGVRSSDRTTPATAFPAGINMAATWNAELIHQYGRAVGAECRANGIHFLLAPGVNIYRSPLSGRNFEYHGEDPYLAGQMAVAYIAGVQSRGVAATVKHYALNNQEWDRNTISSDADERTMREIYLPPFRAAVTQGNVAAVMTAYNLVNGIHCSQHPLLIDQILKKEWQFKGLVMSDWNSTYDAIGAANAGLDMEMPFGQFLNRENLLPAIKTGKVSIDTIDDKVRRLLRLMIRFNFLDRAQTDSSIPRFNPESRKTALETSRQGMVLLKNSDGFLPVNKKKISSIAVIGPKAHPAAYGGGGSSEVNPFRSVSLLDGIINQAGPEIPITYHPGIQSDIQHYFKKSKFFCLDKSGKTVKGLRAEYFNGINLEGPPVMTQIDKQINFIYKDRKALALGRDDRNYSVRWTGWIEPDHEGDHYFLIQGYGGYRLFVDGQQVFDKWYEIRGWSAPTTEGVKVHLPSGKKIPIRLECAKMRDSVEIHLGWIPPVQFEAHEALSLAEKADMAVVCVGFNPETELEGYDRSFELPFSQGEFIKEVAKVNPNTLVIIVAGGNVSMAGWIDDVKGLLHAWYPGQEGGTAGAEIVFGEINPSGKLPVSFETEWSDNPTFRNYHDEDGDKRVSYREGLFIGYRYYDKTDVKPLFPFGFGLSYTSFSFSNLKAKEDNQKKYAVQVDVTNTGKKSGHETVQVYIRDVESSLPRPVKELKAFAKVFLKPGETRTVSLKLDREAFMFFSPKAKNWILEPGQFEILVGASSQDIRLKKIIEIL